LQVYKATKEITILLIMLLIIIIVIMIIMNMQNKLYTTQFSSPPNNQFIFSSCAAIAEPGNYRFMNSQN